MRPVSLVPHSRASFKQIIIASAAVFLIAFGVRLLSWHDTRTDVWSVQTVVAGDYQRTRQLLRQSGLRGFFDPSGPLADPNLLGHPPGYPIVQAFLATLFGDSTTVVQLFQITCDALAAVLVLLIAIELLPLAVGVIAGLLAAFSPQFAWNSVLLLPDTLAVVPLLLAMYFVVSALTNPRLLKFMLAGCCVGLSCWLRANALLLAPFLALSLFLLFKRGERLRYASMLLAGALIVVAPLTIRNWIVHRHFIPVSLGAGQTMLEGIANYDPARRFGVPDTDMGIMKMEAEQYNRPDYYSTLFAPDGVKRERLRLARGAKIVANNPVWFMSVMVRRAGSMSRLERARRISPDPPVTHSLANIQQTQPVWRAGPAELLAQAEKPPEVGFSVSADGQMLRIASDQSSYGTQIKSAPVAVKRNHDYLIRIPTLVEEGRMSFNVVGAQSGRPYVSSIVEKAEVKAGQTQPVTNVETPFVSSSEDSIRLEINNAAPAAAHSRIQIGALELYDLGPASFLWTRYPRILIRAIQGLFITAIMLPLALLGIVILVRRRNWQTLTLLLVVPAYYLCFQSVLHTEYRYVLALHYFFFILVGLAIHAIWSLGITQIRRKQSPAVTPQQGSPATS